MNKPHISLLPYKDTEFRWMCTQEVLNRIYTGYGRSPEEAFDAMIWEIDNEGWDWEYFL